MSATEHATSARQAAVPKIKLQGTVLTPAMATLLIGHVAEPRPIRNEDRQTHTLKALRARHLIYFNRPNRPTHTLATSRGREIIAALLAARGDY